MALHSVRKFRRKLLLVPKVGLEPTWGYPHPLLRRARLPFRHFGLFTYLRLKVYRYRHRFCFPTAIWVVFAVIILGDYQFACCQLLFFALYEPALPIKHHVTYAYAQAGIIADVPHPVCTMAATCEDIESTVPWCRRKPQLHRVRLARYAACRGQVAVLFRWEQA